MSSPSCDLLIPSIRRLYPFHKEKGPFRLSDLQEEIVLENYDLAIRGSQILELAPAPRLQEKYQASTLLDTHDALVTPGLIDCHTHAVFYGTRFRDFEKRLLNHVPYERLTQTGGGILETVQKTRQATPEAIQAFVRPFLHNMFIHGTTTCEVKSGYGLDLKTELKLLQAIQELDRELPLDLIPTYLGAHALAPEWSNRPDEYIDFVLDTVLPEVHRRRLAQAIDLFVDPGFFELRHAQKLFTQAKALGLGLKVHAEELFPTGVTTLAVREKALSCDHLNYIGDEEIAALASSQTIGVLLPGTSFFLKSLHLPPVQKMLEAGAALALASDFNPGTCFSPSLISILSLAALDFGLSPYTLFAFVTLNAAYALGKEKDIGSLAPGKQADLVLWKAEDLRDIPYSLGINWVETVVKKGKIYPQLP